MTGESRQTGEATDEATEAFVALTAEVERLRQAVEARPDIAPTLAVMARALTAMEKHPSLALTPRAYADQLRAAQETARREGEQALSQAAGRMNIAVGELARIVEQARAAERQNWRLLQVGLAGLIGGAVLWGTLSGPIARTLPAGWRVPEKMAAAIMGESSWDAGARMMQSASPEDWARVVAAWQIEKANLQPLSTCRAASARTGRAQRCSVVVDAPDGR